jgi:hypothetical protein
MLRLATGELSTRGFWTAALLNDQPILRHGGNTLADGLAYLGCSNRAARGFRFKTPLRAGCSCTTAPPQLGCTKMPAGVRSATSRPTSIRAIAGVVRLQCSSGRSLNEYLKHDRSGTRTRSQPGRPSSTRRKACLEMPTYPPDRGRQSKFPGMR